MVGITKLIHYFDLELAVSPFFVNSTSLNNYWPRARFYPYLAKTTRYLSETKKFEFGISKCTSPENFRYLSNEIKIL